MHSTHVKVAVGAYSRPAAAYGSTAILEARQSTMGVMQLLPVDQP